MEISLEEKKAIEFIKELIAWDVRQDLCLNKEECENLEIILNLIEKLQKENEEKTTIILAGAEKVKQVEKENKTLKNFTSSIFNGDIEKNSIIIKDKNIRNGQAVIKGTRLTVIDILIFMCLFIKKHEDEFRKNYADVSSEQIIALLDYFIDNIFNKGDIK